MLPYCMQIGSEAWWDQHDAVMSLSTQAQHNVASRSDEFVKEALVLHDKLRVLVFDLLAHEVRLAPGCMLCAEAAACPASAQLPLMRCCCMFEDSPVCAST